MLFHLITSFASVIVNSLGSQNSMKSLQLHLAWFRSPSFSFLLLTFTCFSSVITDWPNLVSCSHLPFIQGSEFSGNLLGFWIWDCSGHRGFFLLTYPIVDVAVECNRYAFLDPENQVCNILKRMRCNEIEFS